MNKFSFVKSISIGENKIGKHATVTDFSILLGCPVKDEYRIKGIDGLKGRIGAWWTSDYDPDITSARLMNYKYWDTSERFVGARPSIKYSIIKEQANEPKEYKNGIMEITYGEYPQTIVDGNLSNQLESLYQANKLNTTGKTYTTDSVSILNKKDSFTPREHIEYEFNSKKYIRINEEDYDCQGIKLSDGTEIKNGHTYWIAVEPITWLINPLEDLAITKEIVFAGIQFKNPKNHTNYIDNCDIINYMNIYFAKDIIPSKSLKTEISNMFQENQEEKKETIIK